MLIGFFLKGLLVGIVIAVPVGPVGILCIRRTILDGRLAGLFSGLGAATADSVFGIIAGFGLTVISDSLFYYQDFLRIGAAAFLLYVGIASLMSDPDAKRRSDNDPEGLFGDFASTFVLTITNPVTILSFIAIFGAIGFTGEEATLGHAAILVAGVWCGSFMWWLGLIAATGVLRLTFKRRHLVWINRGSGGILVFAGVLLLGSLVLEHWV
ncbi:MAG TPA: LysE family transporter [Stellaceae bacterium]|jgi:threonine/homoserine/homoserine lactone efflux protein|nr:LysE family transporter [Stellaceae bacterium]